MGTAAAPNLWYREIHFLDVGHGDCTIIDIPERLTVIDINNCKTLARETEAQLKKKYESERHSSLVNSMYSGAAQALGGGMQSVPTMSDVIRDMALAEQKLTAAKNKLTNPIDYLKRHFPGRSIFRYIQTHPDLDHMAGLHRLIEERIEIVNLWDTKHCITKNEEGLRTGQANNKDIKDWYAYQWLRGGTAPALTILNLVRGASNTFYAQDGIAIWAPADQRHSANPNAEPNALSYVLSLLVGKCCVVFGGDADIAVWEEMHDFCNGKFPKVHLLKASHHGRKSGYHMPSVRAMNPDVTILSVGELKTKDDANASYERYSNKGCHSTVEHGDIVARCWSSGVIWLRERDSKQWYSGDFSTKIFREP
jgi:competence protein ComEC